MLPEALTEHFALGASYCIVECFSAPHVSIIQLPVAVCQMEEYCDTFFVLNGFCSPSYRL